VPLVITNSQYVDHILVNAHLSLKSNAMIYNFVDLVCFHFVDQKILIP